MNQFDDRFSSLISIDNENAEQINLDMDIREEQLMLPALNENDEIIEMGEDFDFSGFQVVRREFFAHISVPSVTFNNCKFYVNMACLAKFPTTDYAQVLVNRKEKVLALRPCPEGSRDSFQWCSISKGKRKPKQITCRLFFAKIVSLMDWNPNNRYKLLGTLIHSNDEYLITFDLTSPGIYQRAESASGKVKASRTPMFPVEWQDQFGLPYNEHKKSMQINIVDGYAVYSIKETSQEKIAQPIKTQDTTLPIGMHNQEGELI